MATRILLRPGQLLSNIYKLRGVNAARHQNRQKWDTIDKVNRNPVDFSRVGRRGVDQVHLGNSKRIEYGFKCYTDSIALTLQAGKTTYRKEIMGVTLISRNKVG